MIKTYDCKKCDWEGYFSQMNIENIKAFGIVGVCPECGNILLEYINRDKKSYKIETDDIVCIRGVDDNSWSFG